MSDLKNPRYPDHLDPDLLEKGTDTRNVIDVYKYWNTEAIRASLETKRMPYGILVENLAHDFNIGTVVRNANAFLAGEIIISGRRDWDRRGAVGTHIYERLTRELRSDETIERYKNDGYRVVAFDNIPGAVSLFDYEFPLKTLMLFGQESIGLSSRALEAADDVVYIPQYGSTRSLNVGVASGIAMGFYMSQHGEPIEATQPEC
jgi:tRNA G18 (ribose-2'-O)-methylase SpoU